MKIIPLSRGCVALIDDEDYELVSRYTWHVMPSKGKFFYGHTFHLVDGKWKGLLLHRLIMGITDPKIWVDHRDHATLNCQKYNLRICTPSQNNSNSIRPKTLPFRGIRFRKNNRKFQGKYDRKEPTKLWAAVIRLNNRTIRLGSFHDPVSAAKAYDAGARKYHGEFATTNFPPPSV